MSEQATTEAVDEAIAESEAPVADLAQTPDGETNETDEETVDDSTSDDDLVDFEHEGKSFKIPKELNRGFLREDDYTRKTQEIAQTRAALESQRAEITQQAQAQATTLEERATLKSVETALQQYDAIDWTQYAQQFGAEQAIAAQGQWQQLQRAKATLSEEIAKKEADHRSASERTRATALQDAERELSTAIKGFSSETVRAVAEIAQSVGFTPLELRESLIGPDGKPDIRSFTVLHRLREAEAKVAKYEAKNKTALIAEKQAAVTPAKTVGQKAGGYKPGLADDLPIEEWNRRRQAQLAKR